MKITAIGRGNCFAPISIGNSNFLLEEDGKFMMFDFGQTAMYILRDEMGFDLQDIDALWVSESHPDHCGGIPFLAFYRYFVHNKSGQTTRPKLYVRSDFIEPLWNYTLKGGLDGLYGKVATITDYFECCPISRNKSFVWQGIEFTPFQTTHVNTTFQIKLSYGLYFYNSKTGKTGMITGDTTFCPDNLNYLYNKSDLILHDCETSEFRSRVHANIADLRTLPENIKSKMWLYHYNDQVDDTGFAGFVEKGQEFII